MSAVMELADQYESLLVPATRSPEVQNSSSDTRFVVTRTVSLPQQLSEDKHTFLFLFFHTFSLRFIWPWVNIPCHNLGLKYLRSEEVCCLLGKVLLYPADWAAINLSQPKDWPCKARWPLQVQPAVTLRHAHRVTSRRVTHTITQTQLLTTKSHIQYVSSSLY